MTKPADINQEPATTAQRPARNAIVYNLGFFDSSPAVSDHHTLLPSIRRLRERHEQVQARAARPGELATNLISLRLAEAFLERCALDDGQPERPLQIAVIGPTQAGKSSVVNLLLGERGARVSPLAGFTVHPQAFCVNAAPERFDWLNAYFHGYQRCLPDQLPPERYDYFAVSTQFIRSRRAFPASLVWDTPDFDSVSAQDYRSAVLRSTALADVLVLVVSKDKYADQSVWDTMRLIEPLAQPTVICLNKISPDTLDTLAGSLKQKWRDTRSDPPPPIIALPYLDDWDSVLPSSLADESERLHDALADAIHHVKRGRQWAHAKDLIVTHADRWLAPVRKERASHHEWAVTVDGTIDEVLSIYRRDYLDHPQHYETFQRALAELLTLLEVPGVAGAVLAARKVVTWPVRQIARLGRSLRSGTQDANQETAILLRLIEHLLIRLNEVALDKCEEHPDMVRWWRETAESIRMQRSGTLDPYTAAVYRYRQDFQPQIDATARRLLDKLREHPAVLNSLRATRLTADAAAVALALHTGGIGIHDFVIAPAILSLTTLLTEGALGHFLHRAELELKQRQFDDVQSLFTTQFAPRLRRLTEQLDPTDKFNIPDAESAPIEELLR